MSRARDKVVSLGPAVEWRASLRHAGGSLVVTNGCFDLLHRGHCELLNAAAELGDCLLVLLNSDASVRSLKGAARPVNEQAARAYVLASLAAVDRVVVFGTLRCDGDLLALAPDVYVKAGDYTLDTLDPGEREALEKVGAQVVFLPLVPGYSTTETLADAACAGLGRDWRSAYERRVA